MSIRKDELYDHSPNYIVPYGDSPRRISPKFPSIADALIRRQKEREKFAARGLLLGIFVGLGVAFWQPGIGALITGWSGVGFALTCWVTGRHQR